jgi:hypothetical protein
MTPQEKAVELVNKFSDYTVQESWQSKNYFAIECALIAVDEILNLNDIDMEYSFYIEVKNEINKL